MPDPQEVAQAGQAFDRVAADYDHEATDILMSRWIRERVWGRLGGLFSAGQHVLEIGCGTGEDATWLAQRGVHVTATDASPHMLAITRQKADQRGVSPLVRTQLLDLNVADRWTLDGVSTGQRPDARFDGAFSNYGALNCVGDWRGLGAALGRLVRPGGRVGFAVMGPFCLWESLWHSIHGDMRTAGRRWRGRANATIGGVTFAVYYPSPGRFSRDLREQVRREHVRGLGVWLPPSDVYGVVGKRPALARVLRRLEAITAAWPLAAHLADHFWWEGRVIG